MSIYKRKKRQGEKGYPLEWASQWDKMRAPVEALMAVEQLIKPFDVKPYELSAMQIASFASKRCRNSGCIAFELWCARGRIASYAAAVFDPSLKITVRWAIEDIFNRIARERVEANERQRKRQEKARQEQAAKEVAA